MQVCRGDRGVGVEERGEKNVFCDESSAGGGLVEEPEEQAVKDIGARSFLESGNLAGEREARFSIQGMARVFYRGYLSFEKTRLHWVLCSIYRCMVAFCLMDFHRYSL